MQDRAREDLARLVGELLTEAGIAFDRADPHRYATPRRLTVVVTGLAAAAGRPRRRAQGTARRRAGAGAGRVPARPCRARATRWRSATTRRRRVLFALGPRAGQSGGRAAGRAAAAGDPARLPWPKSMRWGDGEFRWVRPLQSILCLLDGEVVPFEFGGVAAGDTHARPPLHGAGAVRGPRLRRLCRQAARRQGDPRRRRAPAMIARARRGAGGGGRGCALADDPALLDELKGLVEWPVPLLAAHRRGLHGAAARGAGHAPCAPTRNIWRCARRTARWRRRFVARRQHGGQRRRGRHRRRQRARAARPAVGRPVLLGPGPQGVAGEPPAGAGPDGVPRRAGHAGPAGRAAGGAGRRAGAATCRAPTGRWPSARRCWPRPICVTGMVGEFPELQGIMGGHYAAAQGEPRGGGGGDPRALRAQGPRRSLPERARRASSWRWPTSSTRWPASSPPASARPAPRTRSRCAAPALGVIRLILENRPAPAAAAGRSRRRRAAMASGSRRWLRAPSAGS